MWKWINEKKEDIHAALMADDDRLATILLDPGKTYLLWGFEGLVPDQLSALREDPEGHGIRWTMRLTSEFLRLAEAVGARRLANPE